MAVPPFSFTSFSPASPPPPSSEPSKQHEASRPEVAPAPTVQPVLFPTDGPAAVPETPPTPPINQSVTVVVSPVPSDKVGGAWRRWTGRGAFLGLLAGLLGGWYYHSKLPGTFESTARLVITGPAPAADAETQIAILHSKAVAERAARKLDEFRPFELPPPKEPSARVAFLEKGMSVSALLPESGGSTLNLSFQGKDRIDTPKYLRALVDAYRAEVTSRSPARSSIPASPSPKPAARVQNRDLPSKVASLPEAASPPLPMNKNDEARLKSELAALGSDSQSTIESRLYASQAASEKARIRLVEIERSLALIRSANSSPRDRQALLEEFGLKPETPPVASPRLADVKAAEELLRTLELKKAELGQRLGPDHRDMIALGEQMKLAKGQLAKAAPTPKPKGPDELEGLRVKLEGERLALASQAGIFAAAMATDQKLLARVNEILQKLQALAARPKNPAKAPAPREPIAARDPLPPAAAPAPAPAPTTFTVQASIPDGEARRIGPPYHRSLVPGGLLGLIGGSLLGLVAALLFAPGARSNRSKPKARVPIAPSVPRPSSATFQMTSGPKLGIPVFAHLPAFRVDVPPEKRSAEGLSPLLVAFSQPSGSEAAILRHARRELTHSLGCRGHQVIPITSPGPGEGKSLVAANLAISLAQSGKRVVLVDCDLKSAKVQELFKLTRLGDSLKSIMASEVDLRMAVRTCEVPNLFLLPAGRGVADPFDLLNRPKFRELIAELKSNFEYVIIDSPSTEAGKELEVIGATADGVVVVVRAGAEVQSRSDRARSQVIEMGMRVLGAIVNAVPNTAPPPASPSKADGRALAHVQ